MKVAVFSTKTYDRRFLEAANAAREHKLTFFEDLSSRVIQDDVFMRLLTFPNVIITGHQAFFTENGLRPIAETTLGNITAFERGEPLVNQVTLERVKGR